MLKEWLEQQGHAVLDTGLSRSGLVGKSIKRAKEGHTLGRITLSLFYTTDFADRLENEIVPAIARRLCGAHGPLHLLVDGPRHGARARSCLGAKHSPFCSEAGCRSFICASASTS